MTPSGTATGAKGGTTVAEIRYILHFPPEGVRTADVIEFRAGFLINFIDTPGILRRLLPAAALSPE
jgi:hypothetical protein